MRIDADTSSPNHIRTAYWRSHESIVNLGDFATQLLLEWFGFQPIVLGAVNPSRSSRCLLACGTIISEKWFRKLAGLDILVWGSGASERNTLPVDVKRATFHAVRGPRTARLLHLENIPFGDPALLFPYFRPFSSTATDQLSIFIPHFLTSNLPKTLPMGFERMCSMGCHRTQWTRPLDVIAAARFVGSSSLHGCIFAHAYGRPWSPFLRAGEDLNMPGKWKDWLEYLDLDPTHPIPSTLSEAERWWETQGRQARRPSLKPLITSFPYPVLSDDAQAILAKIP